MSQSGKVPSVRFSADEDELLVEFVQKEDILYDLKHPEFKNMTKKDLLWNEIGRALKKEDIIDFLSNQVLQFSRACPMAATQLRKPQCFQNSLAFCSQSIWSAGGSECKKRWRSMRDHCKREKKEEKGTTRKAANKKRAQY
ncbi:uncharacterized protein LOC119650992 [Hermetia illucens]|uniref:uncharacterized protein LOC119650992 n=1 Tax=Hermetia illucens TaxID=343691 RepID=UPI0018CC37EC|nr:uncharacterized protein LOC119650992 [Hermetia illucens]